MHILIFLFLQYQDFISINNHQTQYTKEAIHDIRGGLGVGDGVGGVEAEVYPTL